MGSSWRRPRGDILQTPWLPTIRPSRGAAATEKLRIEPSDKIRSSSESRRQLSVDNRVDQDRPQRGGCTKLPFRPRQPCWIAGGDVEQ
jgi:hypothetical protein